MYAGQRGEKQSAAHAAFLGAAHGRTRRQERIAQHRAHFYSHGWFHLISSLSRPALSVCDAAPGGGADLSKQHGFGSTYPH